MQIYTIKRREEGSNLDSRYRTTSKCFKIFLKFCPRSQDGKIWFEREHGRIASYRVSFSEENASRRDARSIEIPVSRWNLVLE